MTARALLLSFAFASLLASGCWRNYREPPRAYPPSGGTYIPPQNIPVGPPAPPLPPVPRGSSPDPSAELLLPQNPPPKNRSEYPRVVPPDRGGAILGDPDVVDKEPAKDEKKANPADDASGIKDFIQVKEGLSTGRRPEIEGLDWLKAKGYKTVVHIKKPGDDDTTDRRQVERREMKYVPLELTPETLTQEWLDDFNRIVADSASRPMFIYAGDSTTAFAVWYLHLRTAEFLTHDEAMVRAGRLGTKDEKSAIFQAAQKVVPPN